MNTCSIYQRQEAVILLCENILRGFSLKTAGEEPLDWAVPHESFSEDASNKTLK